MKFSSCRDFESLGLGIKVLKGVNRAGFKVPTPIQARAIPEIFKRNDILAQAQTGTGKTAAFVLPILDMINHNEAIQALIITPTRELAIQVSEEVFRLGKFLKTRTVCVYGGQSISKQCEIIAKGPHVMVATPGRLLDHLKNGRIDNFTPRFVVLDESDEMLDMGFLDDIEEIFHYIPQNAQILLFSATMPPGIKILAGKLLTNPSYIHIAPSVPVNTNIDQIYYMVRDRDKQDAMLFLLENEKMEKSIIFTRTKKDASVLSNYLSSCGHQVRCLHGDMNQFDRRSVMNGFRNSEFPILVATDVASRGLDISDVSHVFNYHVPLNSEVYIHRIGRTGRAGKRGRAITLIAPSEFEEFINMQKQTTGDLQSYESLYSVVNPSRKASLDRIKKEILRLRIEDEAYDIFESIKEDENFLELALRLLGFYLRSSSKDSKPRIPKKHHCSRMKPARFRN